MNDMVQRLDVIHPDASPKGMTAPISELEAFIQMDDTLAQLNKDYLEAKVQRLELVALNGADDAMAEVALDMEDSAWCAMQTRYLELREERELMERAQRMMRKIEAEIEKVKLSEQAAEARQVAGYMKVLERIKQMAKEPKIYELLLLFMIFKFEPFQDRPDPFMRQAVAA